MRSPEGKLQESLITFHRIAVDGDEAILFAVPNGGYRTKRTAATLRRQGLLAGVADLILVVFGKVIFIELKAPGRRSSQSEAQKIFQRRVETLGHPYHLICSVEEYAELLNKYGVRTKAALLV